MSNIWSRARKQIELWNRSGSVTLTAGTGVFNIIGRTANLLAPVVMFAGTGNFHITGNTAILTFSGSGGGTSGSPVGLLLALTNP